MPPRAPHAALASRKNPMNLVPPFKALAAIVLASTVLSGCGVLAAPCRVASAGIKMVPVVGHVAAAPPDLCAAVIDP